MAALYVYNFPVQYPSAVNLGSAFSFLHATAASITKQMMLMIFVVLIMALIKTRMQYLEIVNMEKNKPKERRGLIFI